MGQIFELHGPGLEGPAASGLWTSWTSDSSESVQILPLMSLDAGVETMPELRTIAHIEATVLPFIFLSIYMYIYCITAAV